MTKRTACSLIALVFLLTPAAWPASDSAPTFRAVVGEVQITLVATDPAGRPVQDLAPVDLLVLEDGRPISGFQLRPASNLPLDLVLVIDLSSSTVPAWEATRAAASSFLRDLVRPGDRTLALTFDSAIRERMTTSDGFDRLPAPAASGRQTALFDTLYLVCRDPLLVAGTEPRRSAIILFSDGDDNLSRYSREEAIAEAQRAGVAVYTVTLHDPDRAAAGDSFLADLAAGTGGLSLVVRDTGEMRSALHRIAGELRTPYLLYYRPPGDLEGRQFRRVRVVPADLYGPRIRARQGYYTSPVR